MGRTRSGVSAPTEVRRYPEPVTSATTAYAARASEYTSLLGSMTSVHPQDRLTIDTWAKGLTGPVLDAGCGPGHWTAHLRRLGLDVRGIDLVPGFVTHARRAHPGIRFELESIDDIREHDASLGGVLSWFSTIHHDPDAVARPLSEFARVLRPGGRLALGFFSGPRVEAFDHAVFRAHRWPVETLADLLSAAGFDVTGTYLREERGQRAVGTLVAERRPDLHRP